MKEEMKTGRVSTTWQMKGADFFIVNILNEFCGSWYKMAFLCVFCLAVRMGRDYSNSFLWSVKA